MYSEPNKPISSKACNKTSSEYLLPNAIFSFIEAPVGEQDRPVAKNIIYNEITDRFVDTPTFNTQFGLSFNSNAYYFNRTSVNQLFLHNGGNRGEYYGFPQDSKLTIAVNETGSLAKVFDNIRMNINDSAPNMIKEIIMETQEQLVSIDMTTDTRWKYLEQLLRSPLRGVDQINRMRGKWIKITFVFDNT